MSSTSLKQTKLYNILNNYKINLKMKNTYILEFNEEQIQFHLNRGNEKIAEGWDIILPNITDSEMFILECFLYSKYNKKELTIEIVKEELNRLKLFWSKLLDKNYTITKQ